MIGEILNKEVKIELIDAHSSRPGHDIRYALDGQKLLSTGFKYPVPLRESLEKVVNWTTKPENRRWLDI
jgi:dTDP-glucose 4,6-dehydratase